MENHLAASRSHAPWQGDLPRLHGRGTHRVPAAERGRGCTFPVGVTETWVCSKLQGLSSRLLQFAGDLGICPVLALSRCPCVSGTRGLSGSGDRAPRPSHPGLAAVGKGKPRATGAGPWARGLQVCAGPSGACPAWSKACRAQGSARAPASAPSGPLAVACKAAAPASVPLLTLSAPKPGSRRGALAPGSAPAARPSLPR